MGGVWKLLHLRGTELVADGLTKPLSGQAFYRFLEDLGIKRGDQPGDLEKVNMEEPEERQSNGDGKRAAILALTTGSLLLSGMDGNYEGDEDSEFSTIWMVGTILMALGAVYAGQVIHSASSCCLRRLRVSMSGGDRRTERGGNSEESSEGENILMESENEFATSASRSKGGASSSRLRRQSGSNIGSTTTKCSATRKVNVDASKKASAKSGAKRLDAGAPTISLPLQRQSGSSSGELGSSLTLRQQSGSSSGELDVTLTLRQRSGSGGAEAAGEPVAEQGAVVTRSVDSSFGGRWFTWEFSKGSKRDKSMESLPKFI